MSFSAIAPNVLRASLSRNFWLKILKPFQRRNRFSSVLFLQNVTFRRRYHLHSVLYWRYNQQVAAGAIYNNNNTTHSFSCQSYVTVDWSFQHQPSLRPSYPATSAVARTGRRSPGGGRPGCRWSWVLGPQRGPSGPAGGCSEHPGTAANWSVKDRSRRKAKSTTRFRIVASKWRWIPSWSGDVW